MSTLDALRMVRDGISNSRSACPDVSIGRVHTLLGLALAKELEPFEPQELRRFILGQVLLNPLKRDLLTHLWAEEKYTLRNPPALPTTDDYDPVWAKAYSLYVEQVGAESDSLEADAEKAINELLAEGLLQEDPQTHRISPNIEELEKRGLL